MDSQRNVDRLAGYLIKIGVIAILALLCWYFRGILLYVVLAFVVSLIGKPIKKLLAKIRIVGHSAPDWLLAILTLVLIFGGLFLLFTRMVPVISGIISDASIFSHIKLPEGNVIEDINKWVISVIPGISEDFDAVGVLLDRVKEVVSDISVTSLLGSVASAVAGIVVGLFSVAFISFFFIKNDGLFGRIIAALVPDRIEESVGKAISDIERLLSRYFIGLLVEMTGVALLDFLGLWLIARIGAGYALGIAFIAGILNVIPYIGPLIGEILGALLCVVLKYGVGVGLDVNIWVFAGIVLVIMLSVQLIDNFIYQPLIYSSSIQATPLEIFIVILVAGHIGGVLGMLAAIPAYTVIRVVAGRFFYKQKAVRRLIPDRDKSTPEIEI